MSKRKSGGVDYSGLPKGLPVHKDLKDFRELVLMKFSPVARNEFEVLFKEFCKDKVDAQNNKQKKALENFT